MPLPIMPSPMKPTFMCPPMHPLPSCPGLTRASTEAVRLPDVDGRSSPAMTNLVVVAVAQLVVDAAVAGEPAREFAVSVGSADCVDLGDIGRVAGEFEDH